MSSDTIFALSSGRPPAAIAVVRVSGPRARAALSRIEGLRMAEAGEFTRRAWVNRILLA